MTADDRNASTAGVEQRLGVDWGTARLGRDFLAERRKPSGRWFNYEGIVNRRSIGRLAPCRYLLVKKKRNTSWQCVNVRGTLTP